MKRILIAILTALTLLAGWTPAAHAADRTPLLMEGKKTLYQRVITHPGASLYAGQGEGSTVIQKAVRPFSVPDVRRWMKRNDARSVTADFLIRHIDYVFGVWEKRPWASYYSFEDFCEFVLPYRIEREPLEFWQEACSSLAILSAL